MLSRALLALVAGAAALTATPSASAARSVTLKQAVTGAPVTIAADVAHPSTCRVTAAQGPQRAIKAMRAPVGIVQVTVKFPRRGSGRVSVRCHRSSTIVSVQVVGRPYGKLTVTARARARKPAQQVAVPPAPSASQPAAATPVAQAPARPQAAGPQIAPELEQQAVTLVGRWLTDLQRAGQCTSWVLTRRPEIFEVVELTNAREQIAAGQTTLRPRPWDARYIAQYAQQVGFTVTAYPQVGAVMVDQPGVDGAGPSGHVAVVERVDGDGTFTVSEMNAQAGPGRVSNRTLSAASADGRQFVL